MRAAGCDAIRAEKRSGATTQGRDEPRVILDFLHPGDVLMATCIHRLPRSIADLQDIVRQVRAPGASLRAMDQPIDTGTAARKCFFDMLGVFAEFETNLRKERQLEGNAKAKAAGVYKSRRTSIDTVREMKAKGLGAPPPSPRRSALAERASTGCCKRYSRTRLSFVHNLQKAR